jgi:putative hydrolase of the HAD superfamily
MEALKLEYRNILAQKTSCAFIDGKTSHEYLAERFSALLEFFSHAPTQNLIDELLSTYETTLTQTLELKSGALSLLRTLRAMGKKIVVITEGPEDAQERVLEALGLMPKIDFLATTNFFGVSKTEGLFKKVLQHLGIAAQDIAYIGDNEARDMSPAIEVGIYAMHLSGEENFSLDVYISCET